MSDKYDVKNHKLKFFDAEGQRITMSDTVDGPESLIVGAFGSIIPIPTDGLDKSGTMIIKDIDIINTDNLRIYIKVTMRWWADINRYTFNGYLRCHFYGKDNVEYGEWSVGGIEWYNGITTNCTVKDGKLTSYVYAFLPVAFKLTTDGQYNYLYGLGMSPRAVAGQNLFTLDEGEGSVSYISSGLTTRLPNTEYIGTNYCFTSYYQYWLTEGFGDGNSYFPGADSETGGGNGDFDDTSDPINFPELPTNTLANSSLINVYQLNAANVNQLAEKLWSANFLEQLLKLNTNPIENIITLNAVPITINDILASTIKIGNINTEIIAEKIQNEYVVLDCGTLDIAEYWGNALDYTNTNIKCVLPFVGAVDIDCDDVMAGSLSIKYYISVLTGDALAILLCENAYHKSIMYQYACNIAQTAPLTSRDFTQMYSAIAGGAAQIGVMAYTKNTAGLATTAINTAMSVAANSKPSIQRTSGISANTGIMGVLIPYLIIDRPIQQRPTDYEEHFGYPSLINEKLENLEGYTEVDSILIDDIVMQQSERDDLIRILKEGFYISSTN